MRVAGLLVVLLVAAIVADHSASIAAPSPPAPDIGPPATLVANDVRSTAWYCPLASATSRVGAHDTVVLANVARQGVVAEVAGIGDGVVRATRRVRIEPGAPTVLAAPALAGVGGDAVVVEPFGAGVVVEHRVVGTRGTAVGPCATTLSPRWFFPALTTRLGATSSVVLMNPLARSDAVVDVTLYTTDGARAPSALQGLDVPRRSRLAVALNDFADRQAVVGVAIRARAGGRIAAEAIVAQDGRPAVVLGIATLGPAWWFASGTAHAARSLAVLNPNDQTANVLLQVSPVGAAQTIPRTVRVSAGTAIVVDVARLAGDHDYSLYVTAPASSPIAVGDLGTLGASAAHPAPTGLQSVLPAAAGARRWAFAAGASGGLSVLRVQVLDTGARSAQVAVTAGDGRVHALTIAAGDRATVAFPDATPGPIVVTADEPVVVERVLGGASGTTATAGVPASS
jgi:hypothetical protein